MSPVSSMRSETGWIQGALLAAVPTMTVINNMAVIPIIPRLVVVFASTPNSRILVPMAAAMPILGIALSSIVAGAIGERIGRRRLLEISTLLFTVVAILPFWLNSLALILVVRAMSGLALGAMATSGVGLTGDYFSGRDRQRWLSIQTGVSSGAGMMVSVIVGALGEVSWRRPFLIMLIGFPFFLALLLLPARRSTSPGGQRQEEELEPGARAPIPWRSLTAIFVLAVAACLIVYPPLFQLGLVLQEKHLGGAALAGLANAADAAGGVAGALGVGLVLRLSGPAKMAVVFAVGGLGTFLIAVSDQVLPIMVGAVVVGLSQGAMVPILQNWLLDRTPALARGRVVGLFTTTVYLSWFLTPLLAGWVSTLSASTSSGMVYYELAAATAVALILASSVRRPTLLLDPR